MASGCAAGAWAKPGALMSAQTTASRQAASEVGLLRIVELDWFSVCMAKPLGEVAGIDHKHNAEYGLDAIFLT